MHEEALNLQIWNRRNRLSHLSNPIAEESENPNLLIVFFNCLLKKQRISEICVLPSGNVLLLLRGERLKRNGDKIYEAFSEKLRTLMNQVRRWQRILILSLLLLSVLAPIVFVSNRLKSITSVGELLLLLRFLQFAF